MELHIRCTPLCPKWKVQNRPRMGAFQDDDPTTVRGGRACQVRARKSDRDEGSLYDGLAGHERNGHMSLDQAADDGLFRRQFLYGRLRRNDPITTLPRKICNDSPRFAKVPASA